MAEINQRSAEMQVFLHHIYEFEKGLRNLVLHTMSRHEQKQAEALLIRKGISYHLQVLGKHKMNVFFGQKVCVDIVASFADKPFSAFSDEQDFILGTMLGYDRVLQCKRYLKRKGVTAVLDSSKVLMCAG